MVQPSPLDGLKEGIHQTQVEVLRLSGNYAPIARKVDTSDMLKASSPKIVGQRYGGAAAKQTQPYATPRLEAVSRSRGALSLTP